MLNVSCRTRLAWRLACATLCATTVAACGRDTVTDTKGDPAALYASTSFEPRGSIIALNGTQQLTVIPLDLDGDSLALPATMEFWSGDSSKVLVSQDGVVSGVGVTGGLPTAVMVRVRAGNVTRVDTAYVSVTDIAYQPASLQLTTPYGAEGWILFGQVTIAPEVTDVDGHVITGGHAHLWGGKTIEVMQSTSSVMGKDLGSAWVTGRLTAYGVTLTDSVQVRFTPIPFAAISIDSTASGQLRSDMAGYKVWFPTNTPLPFSNNTATTITIVFAGPTPVPPEITLPPGGSDFPMFTAEGDYTWTVKSAPTVSGTITVMD